MRRTLLVAFLTLLGGAAMANEGRFDRLSSRLGLDADSKAKVEATIERYRAQMLPLRKDARRTREALRAELVSGHPNEGRVSSLTTQLQGDRRQLMQVKQQRANELKSELTPSQYARLMLGHRHRNGSRQ
jgi:Spy/CpxP family protein refolding chaperone